MPAVSSPTVARLSFSRSCSSRSFDGGEIGEQADRAVQLRPVVEQRRHGDAEVRDAVARLGQRHRSAHDRLRRRAGTRR